MYFPTTTILYFLLSLGPSALDGPSAPKPTDLACAGSVGLDGHCLYSIRNEQSQPQGVAVQPESVDITLSEKKGGGGHGAGKPKGGHGSGASNLKCELGVVLFIWFIAIMAEVCVFCST
jgi:hypothetical protein